MSEAHRTAAAPAFRARSTLRIGLAALACAASATPVSGQSDIDLRTPIEGIEIGGRVHAQFSTTSVDVVPSTDFRVRRARLWVAARINDWIDSAVQLDFASGAAEGRYMFVRGTVSPALRVSAGQLKRAFDLFELTSSSQILVVERAGRIRGVNVCAGVGGLCSYSRLSEQLEFSSLDVGVFADGVLAGGSLEYRVSFTNGAGPNQADDNSAKSASGRVQVVAADGLLLGANVATHDYFNSATGRDEHARAVAVDMEWGDFDGGPHFQAGVMAGDNWAQLDDLGDPAGFLTWQTIIAYKRLTRSGGRVTAIEPLFRVSWADPDRSAPSTSGWLLTPGLAAHFDGRNKLAANLDLWNPQRGARAWGVLLQAYVYF